MAQLQALFHFNLKGLLTALVATCAQLTVVPLSSSALVFLNEEGRPPSEVWRLKEIFLPHVAATRDYQSRI